MGIFFSLLGEGLPSTHATSFVMGTLYKQFLEKNISSFEDFQVGILDIFDRFISELPIEYYEIPSRKELEACFNDWKRAPDPQKKELIVGLMKKSINFSKLVDSALITGIVTAAMAAKKAGDTVPQLKRINDIPNFIFVPSVTLLSLASIKLTRWIFLGNAILDDIPPEDADEEAVSDEQPLQGKGKMVKNVAWEDLPRQPPSHLQQVEEDSYPARKHQAQANQSRERSGLARQGSLRRPGKRATSRSTSASLSINPKSKLSSEQPQALVEEMLSLFEKFESELTPSAVETQVAQQNVSDTLKTGTSILQEPEQVKKLKRSLHLLTQTSEDSLAAGQISIITNFEQEIDMLEAKFRNAADVLARASQLQANKEQAEKHFQEAYHLLRELKANDDEFKEKIGKLKSEIECLKTAEEKNLRKINDCFQCGKFQKELASKCEMELGKLWHAREKAKKDKADVEAVFKNYRQQLT
ncbi:hypothetical protein MANES_13G115400v8 [Manihot esculenta]|uniref:Uncharacterized protein n=1 Tax=Manihot esculenta TaxID=3983 RepID=A0ACB7GNB1_MANES|nr:hypothetical protein MANES_13G115400v8 [Manihot esculenta]